MATATSGDDPELPELCSRYGSRSSCTAADCEALHLCQEYAAGDCREPQCAFPHTLETPRNIRVLRAAGWQGEDYLARAMTALRRRVVRQRSRRPTVCLAYNSGGCWRQPDPCPHMHVCFRYVLGTCPDPVCPLTHSLTDGDHNSAVISAWGKDDTPVPRIREALAAQLKERPLYPAVCPDDNSIVGCKALLCLRLHCCLTFSTGTRNLRPDCPRRHDLGGPHNQKVLSFFDVDARQALAALKKAAAEGNAGNSSQPDADDGDAEFGVDDVWQPDVSGRAIVVNVSSIWHPVVPDGRNQVKVGKISQPLMASGYAKFKIAQSKAKRKEDEEKKACEDADKLYERATSEEKHGKVLQVAQNATVGNVFQPKVGDDCTEVNVGRIQQPVVVDGDGEPKAAQIEAAREEEEEEEEEEVWEDAEAELHEGATCKETQVKVITTGPNFRLENEYAEMEGKLQWTLQQNKEYVRKIVSLATQVEDLKTREQNLRLLQEDAVQELNVRHEREYDRLLQIVRKQRVELECGICMGVLEEPLTLRCTHSFCKGCLEAMNNRQCPLCRGFFSDKFKCRALDNVTARLRDELEYLLQ